MTIPTEKTERQKIALNHLCNVGLKCDEVPESLVDWLLYTSPYNREELFFSKLLENLKENPEFVPNQKIRFFINPSDKIPSIREYSLPIWWGGFWEYSITCKWISSIAVTDENIIIFSGKSSNSVYIRESSIPCAAGGAYDETPDVGKITVYKRRDFAKIKTQGVKLAKVDKSITDFMFNLLNDNFSSGEHFPRVRLIFQLTMSLFFYKFRKSFYREAKKYANSEELNLTYQNYVNKSGIPLSDDELSRYLKNIHSHFDTPKIIAVKEDSTGDVLRIENLGYVDREDWDKIIN